MLYTEHDDIAIPSVCPSIRLSVCRWHCVKTTEMFVTQLTFDVYTDSDFSTLKVLVKIQWRHSQRGVLLSFLLLFLLAIFDESRDALDRHRKTTIRPTDGWREWSMTISRLRSIERDTA